MTKQNTKKIYIVETTTGDRWEMLGGFYLVEASSSGDAAEAVKALHGDRVKKTTELEVFLANGFQLVGDTRVKTITEPMVE